MYLEVFYEPTTLFSLKQSEATNSGSKSLISPSPYSIKMALLNAIITFDSLTVAKEQFELIRDLNISFSLPQEIVVNNCFIKIMKDNDKETNKAIKELKPFKSTVAFREYVYLKSNISFAVEIKIKPNVKVLQDYDFLKKWFMHINYFGKKGCFFQFHGAEIKDYSALPIGYSSIWGKSFSNGIMFQLDDMSEENKFEDVNTYSDKKPKREKKILVFPYKQIESNKNYTLYRKFI
ncbi:MAG: hypothetical protein GXX85_01435 [Ignavibacteria bacterium]|nr:hypothetical protein [Ignavibacteria bacterium]